MLVCEKREEKKSDRNKGGEKNLVVYTKSAGGQLRCIKKREAGVKEKDDGKKIDENEVDPSYDVERGKVLRDLGKGVMLPRGNGRKNAEKYR